MQCPIPNARTRILDRRQTEGDFNRNFYIVEIVPDDEIDDASDKAPQKVEVDSSRILEFVSPSELERFENDMFRVEAEAVAVAERVEEEDKIKKRMERNARAGKGIVVNQMSLGRGVATRGKPRARGRGRGSERGVAVAGQPQDDELGPNEVLEPVEALRRNSEDAQSHVTMPLGAHTSKLTFRGHSEILDIGDSESDLNDDIDASMQLRFENDIRAQLRIGSSDDDSHRSKRRRTESVAPETTPAYGSRHACSQGAFALDQSPQTAISISAPVFEQSEQTSPSIPSASSPHHINNSMIIDSKATHVTPQHPHPPLDHHSPESIDNEQDGNEDDDDTEEYVVEAIHEHYHDGTQNIYLVKWEGYEKSYDWLPEEHLGGAAELVEEYHKKLRRTEKGKGKA